MPTEKAKFNWTSANNYRISTLSVYPAQQIVFDAVSFHDVKYIRIRQMSQSEKNDISESILFPMDDVDRFIEKVQETRTRENAR